jgi:methyl-accepting chemotaxis protein
MRRLLCVLAYSVFTVILLSNDVFSGTAADSPLTKPLTDWEYAIGDIPRGIDDLPLWDQTDTMKWKQGSSHLHNPPERNGASIIWYRATLPEGKWDAPSLYLESIHVIYEVWIDSVKIFSHGIIAKNGENVYNGFLWNSVSLPHNSGGKKIYFRVFSESKSIGIRGDPSVTETAAIIPGLIRKEFITILLSFLYLCIGAVALVYFLILERDFKMLGFGIFLIGISVWSFAGLKITQLFIANGNVKYEIDIFSLMFGPLGLYFYFDKLFGSGYKKILARFWQANLIFCVIAIPIGLYKWILISEYILISYQLFILLTGLSCAAYIVYLVLGKKNSEAVITMIGFMIITITSLIDVIISIKGKSPGWIQIAPFGTLCFIICQLVILGRRYQTSQRQLAEYSGELEKKNIRMEEIIRGVKSSTDKMLQLSMSATETAIALQGQMSSQGTSLEESSAALTEFSSSIESIAAEARQQNSVVRDGNESINGLIGALRKITEQSRKTELLGEQSISQSQDSRRSLDQIIEGMNRIKESSRAIGEMTMLINDIAERTNLLSLNAAIEAARAGDSGRGFAVVAEEIGKLADRSIQQAKSIQGYIGKTVDDIARETDIINKSASTISGIEKTVGNVAEAIKSIYIMCEEQEAVTSDIQGKMAEVLTGSDHTAHSTETGKITMGEISGEIDHLNVIMEGVIQQVDGMFNSAAELQNEIRILSRLIQE